MNPTLDRLTAQFTQLIGPEAFAKAEAAIAAAKAAEAAAAAAKAAAAAAAAAAAKAAAPAAVPSTAAPAAQPTAAQPAAPRAAVAAPAPVTGVAETGRPASALPATAKPAGPAPARTAVTAPATAAPRPAAATPAAAAPAPLPTLPLQAVAHAAKGYDLDAAVAPTQVVQAAEILDREGFALDAITGVDWIAQNEMEVVYDYFHPTQPARVAVRTRVPRATPEVPTLVSVYPGANWHERETHDFFGIRFTGHPNLKPFLLPEDADFHPLRKDYKP